MSGPFKMSGSQFLGKGNQSKSLNEEMASAASYASPAKNTPETKTKIKVNMNDPKVKANYEKYKDNPEYRDALNKKAGGEFNYDEKTNTSTTKTDI
tara:strand:+ start:1042 stop:1329 length:288 start_codon:yes stop_codon:yes gene_type:complete